MYSKRYSIHMYVYRRSIVELMPGRKGTGSGAGEGAERKVALQTQIGLPFCLTLSRDVARSCYCCCCCCFCYCQPWQIARDTGYRIIKRNKSTFVRAVQTRMTTKPRTGTGHKTQRALICRQEHQEDIEPIQVFLHVGEFTQLPKCPVELITVGTAAAAQQKQRKQWREHHEHDCCICQPFYGNPPLYPTGPSCQTGDPLALLLPALIKCQNNCALQHNQSAACVIAQWSATCTNPGRIKKDIENKFKQV